MQLLGTGTFIGFTPPGVALIAHGADCLTANATYTFTGDRTRTMLAEGTTSAFHAAGFTETQSHQWGNLIQLSSDVAAPVAEFRAEGKVEGLLKLLEIRFGEIPISLREAL